MRHTMAKKIKLEIDQDDIQKLVNECIETAFKKRFESSFKHTIAKAIDEQFESSFTNTIADAVGEKLDDFAFQRRILFDARLQKDIEQMVRKIITSQDHEGVITVLRKYDPDALLKLIAQIKAEQEILKEE